MLVELHDVLGCGSHLMVSNRGFSSWRMKNVHRTRTMPFASGLKTQGAQESGRYRRQKGSHKRQLKHEWQLLALRPSPPLKNIPRGVRIIALSMILMRHSQEAVVIIHLARALHPRHADQDREPFDVNPINQHFSHRIVAKI